MSSQCLGLKWSFNPQLYVVGVNTLLNEKEHCPRFSGLKRTRARLKAQSDSKFGEEAPQMVMYIPCLPPPTLHWLNEEMGRALHTDGY